VAAAQVNISTEAGIRGVDLSSSHKHNKA